jgi:hypothetical protein
MPETSLLQQIGRRNSDKARIAEHLLSKPEDIAVVLQGLNASDARIKFGSSKVLRLASEKKPEIFYPRMEFFVRLLDSENTFLRLDAACVLANLATVDSQGKFDVIFEKYFAPVAGPAMIPAANIIGTAAQIARAKPGLTAKITAEILKVENAKYATEECRNVALGHAIRFFDSIFGQIEDKAPVVNLIKRQLTNTRPATRKKAEAFVKKHGI